MHQQNEKSIHQAQVLLPRIFQLAVSVTTAAQKSISEPPVKRTHKLVSSPTNHLLSRTFGRILFKDSGRDLHLPLETIAQHLLLRRDSVRRTFGKCSMPQKLLLRCRGKTVAVQLVAYRQGHDISSFPNTTALSAFRRRRPPRHGNRMVEIAADDR